MMKKLFTAIAVLAVASIAAAQTTVTGNVVGYSKVATPSAGGFDIVALAQFEDGAGSIGIQDAIKNLGDLNAAGTGGLANADKLYIWTGSGYTIQAALFQPTVGDPIWIAPTDGAWSLSFITPTPLTDVIPRGSSAWIETGASGSSADIMTLGEVYNDGSVDVSVYAFSLIAYPYTSDISLDNLVVSNATAAGTGNLAGADKIYVWTGAGYPIQAALFQPTVGDPIWIAPTDGAWSLSFITPTELTDTLELGKGFWYESADGAKTIGFSQNYTLD
jgi:hypothetical protein